MITRSILSLYFIYNLERYSNIIVQAACGNDVPLCNAAPQIIDNDICIDQQISWNMPSCCSADSIAANNCPSNPQPTCRVLQLSTPFGVSLDECCAELAFTFQWTKSPAQCCRTCSCFGDPHCISFDDKVDNWVLCDGRTKNTAAVYGKNVFCPIKQAACDKQLDHMGRKCVYTPNGKQTADENGSPCQTGSTEPATIVMYKVQNFELDLFLSDRGVIESIEIVNGDEKYYTTAAACAGTGFPWRDTPDGPKPPTDKTWLPYTWTVTKIPFGRSWKVDGLKTGIEIEIRCVYNQKGSVPRINIDALADPQKSRPNESGVCVTGSIDKMLSTADSTIEIDQYCGSVQAEGQAMQHFCGGAAGATKAQCMRTMCGTFSATAKDRDLCASQIMKYQADGSSKDGWNRVWCAYNTLSPSNPDDCNKGECLQCMYDVIDFGWPEAIARWKNFNKGDSVFSSPAACIPLNALNASLGDCQNGITLQYLDTNGLDQNGNQEDCWVDFLSIPQGRNICGGNTISFSSLATTPETNFFDKLIRIKQCNKEANCKSPGEISDCKPEIGVSGTIKLIPDAVTNRANLYWQLVRQNKLVCTEASPNCLQDTYGTQYQEAKCTGCDYCPTK